MEVDLSLAGLWTQHWNRGRDVSFTDFAAGGSQVRVWSQVRVCCVGLRRVQTFFPLCSNPECVSSQTATCFYSGMGTDRNEVDFLVLFYRAVCDSALVTRLWMCLELTFCWDTFVTLERFCVWTLCLGAVFHVDEYVFELRFSVIETQYTGCVSHLVSFLSAWIL